MNLTPMENPLAFIESKIEAGIADAIRKVHIAVVREAVIDGLSRLATLDADHAEKYQQAIKGIE